MAIRVAINGAGRVGRAFVRRAWNRPEIEIVAINDLGSLENIAYLLKYDSVYGRAPFSVETENGALLISNKRVRFFSEKSPGNLPWKDLTVDVVVESTGVFNSYEKAEPHLDAGARRVVLSAPVEGTGEDVPTVLVGINEEKLKTCTISANASCTTNAASPVIAILDESIGIEHALLNTTHAYTASQGIVDSPAREGDFRHGRAAAANIVPHSTGAATAVAEAYKSLAGRFDGIALRVPVAIGSIADITFVAKRQTSIEEVNKTLRNAGKSERWQGIFKATDEQLVSSDIIGEPYGAIADLSLTRVVGGTLVKVFTWYDNEMGYAETLVRHVLSAGEQS